MTAKSELRLIALSAVFLLFVAGCDGGDVQTGAPTTPFLGGAGGLEINFLEGSPPEEVTDGNTFDFQAIVKLKNNGEYDLQRDRVNVSLIGFSPADFGVVPGDEKLLVGENPEDNPTPRQRDSEGNIIEPVETFVTFPSESKNFNFKGDLAGNTVFILRADVCYKYETMAVSEVCVLENMIDVADNAICDPSEAKSIFSSGSPIKVDGFRQSVVGKDKVQFSFDITHSGTGNIFVEEFDRSDCPKDPSERRKKEDKVNVTINTGLPVVSAGVPALNCVGLKDSIAGSVSTGAVTLVNGKRTITCTQTLASSRSDFKRPVDINVSFNYLSSVDKEVLVKHLVD